MLEPLLKRGKRIRKMYQWGLSKIFPFQSLYNYDRVKVMEEDWDYLLVLDACRYDYFKRFNNLDGNLEEKHSLGSGTRQWFERNFKHKYDDTVYVSASPKVSKLNLKKWMGYIPFCHLDEVWDYGWSEDLGTVPPSNVVESALKMFDKYPDKRMIIHFEQPHQPFIMDLENGELLKDKIWGGLKGRERQRGDYLVIDLAMEGKIDADVVRMGYVRNLKLVLDQVKRLIEILPGKIVITADHGQCFGEKFFLGRVYGHPRGIHIPPLIQIPWLEIEGRGKRPDEKIRIRGKITELQSKSKL